MGSALLAANIDGTGVATIVISGIGIVLLMLLLLIGIFYAFGAIVSNAEKAVKKRTIKNLEENMAREADSPVRAEASAVQTKKESVAEPITEPEISGKVVAAISAAVAAYQGDSGTAYVIRSIRKKKVSGRNPWAFAAVTDNTRPF